MRERSGGVPPEIQADPSQQQETSSSDSDSDIEISPEHLAEIIEVYKDTPVPINSPEFAPDMIATQENRESVNMDTGHERHDESMVAPSQEELPCRTKPPVYLRESIRRLSNNEGIDPDLMNSSNHSDGIITLESLLSLLGGFSCIRTHPTLG